MRDTRQEILHFWFEETDAQQWFQANPEYDEMIHERFHVTYEMGRDGLCNDWAHDAEGSLALVILLDQFPRHMFRGKKEAFETDEKALLFAKQAISKGYDQILEPVKRGFLYVPFQHSESLSDQKRSVELMSAMKDENPAGYDYAMRHYAVVDQFGRFPHRNKVLDRISTTKELAFLEENPQGF